MFLLPLAFFAAIALTIWFVVVSEASVPAKVLVAALLMISLLCRYTRYSFAGFFLQIGLGIFILLYRKARSL
jgi:cadmium resistance protein CadD (predicted permease)